MVWPPRGPGEPRPAAGDADEPELKSLGLGMWQYETTEKRFPAAAIYDERGKPLLSWHVELLPFLGEYELYNEVRLDEPWDSEHNLPLVKKMPAVYASPRAGDLGGKTVYLVPTGKETIFFDDKGTSPQQITDGTRTTILIVEADAEHAVQWTKPEDLPIDKEKPAAGLGKGPGGRFTVLGADGAFHRVPGDIDAAALWRLFTRAGGEQIEWPK